MSGAGDLWELRDCFFAGRAEARRLHQRL